MSDKPKFDPSRAYEVPGPAGQKPAFDASQPFQEYKDPVSAASASPIPEEKPSLASTLSRGGVGVSVGVAENANPLAIPHNLEVIGRMPFQDVDQSKGILGRLKERYSKAEDASIIPSVNISQIAAGTRTVLEAPFSDKSIPELYKEESQSQESFNKNFLPKGTKEAGEIGAGLISLGSLAKDVSNVTGLTSAIKDMGNAKAFDALKPIGKAADKIVDQGRATEIGKQLLDDKIVTAGASFKDVLARTQSKLQSYGEKIGYFAKTADQAVERDSSLRGVPVEDLSNSILKEVVQPLSQDPSTVGVSKQVMNWVDNLNTTATGEDLTFQQAQAFKKSLDKMNAKFKTGGDTISKDAFQKVYGILNDKIETGIDTAFAKAAPELTNDFEETKNAYRNLKDAEDLISKTVSRTSKNRAFSLSDYITGAAGGVAVGSATSHPIETGLAGIGLALTNKVARERGNQAAASGMRGLASLMESAKNPSQKDSAAATIGAINYLLRSKQEDRKNAP